MLQMAQPITNPAQGSTPLSPPTGTRVLVGGGHRIPNGHQPWDTGVAHSHPTVPGWPLWAEWKGPGGRALLCLGGGLGETLTHASGLVLTVALGQWAGWGTQRPSWDSWPGGHPQLGCWQPVESGWHTTLGRHVLAGVEAGLPIGEKTLATCRVCSRREAEQVGLGGGPS